MPLQEVILRSGSDGIGGLRLMASAMIAHEAIFDMSREFQAQGSISAEAEGLLRESAQIVTKRLPDMTAALRRLANRWSERDLLERSAVAATVGEIEAEMLRIGPEIERLLDRQRQIASRLRGLLNE